MSLVLQRRLVAFGALVMLLFGCWRATIGADFGDGTHVVALAMRMAQGDWPLSDEMNLQALGSLPAVPFTWVWLSTVGVEGVVLASRLWYVLMALLAGAVGYRALRTGFDPIPSFVAVTVMVLPTPYSILEMSYNSVPVLALAVASCAAFAAVRRASVRWSALSGIALVVAATAHPAVVPPAGVLLVLLLIVGRGPVRRGLLTGALAAALVAALALLVGPGVGALQDTLRYTADYQADRRTAWERLARAVGMHAEGLVAWRNVPALLLAVLAGLPRISARWRGLLAVAAVVALAVAVVAASLKAPPEELLLGTVAAAFVVLATVLLVPFLLVLRDVDGRIRLLVGLTAPPAVVGFIAISLVSSGSAKWGVAAAPVQPLAAAAVLSVLLLIERHHARAVALITAAALLGSLLTVHTMRSFRDAQPWRLDARVEQGPLAGLLTNDAYLADDCDLRRAVRDWVDPGDSVFFWARSAGYAYSEARMDTHNVWLADFGDAAEWGVWWMNEHDRWPDVAFVHAGTLRRAGGWEAVAARDPIIAIFDRDYGAPTHIEGYVVVRKDGSSRVPDPAPPPGCKGAG